MAVAGTLNGEAWANVFWCLLAGGTTATQAALDAWTDAFATAYKNSFANRLHQNVLITSCTSTLFQTPPNALHSSRPVTGAGVGTGVLVLDLSASQIVSWLSSVYWRGGKPRTYLPGMQQSMTTDGKVLTDADRNALAVTGNNFHTAVNALSATGITQTQHGFVSFTSGGVDRPVAQFFPITGATAHKRIGTQRRRLGPWIAA